MKEWAITPAGSQALASPLTSQTLAERTILKDLKDYGPASTERSRTEFRIPNVL